ncbi:MAG: proline--tRNA ligase [Holophagaceae bacterium]
MRQSKLLFQTHREVPKDAEVISHQLMMRSGMLLKLASGVYSYFPLLLRAIQKFENIVREELDRSGCQELLMPLVQPSDLWAESGRWGAYGKELLRFKDRKENDFCLGPTHEEVITDMVRKTVKSYKQLPLNVFQIQTKFRDEVRPRFGLLRGREFIMKDGYSFHVDDADCDKEYWRMFETYRRIFERVGLAFRPVEADSGAIGGSFTHEFHVLAESGEDAILSCSHCDYTSNLEKTECRTMSLSINDPVPLKVNHFYTPNILGQAEQARHMVDEAHPNGVALDRTTKLYLLKVVDHSNCESVWGAVLLGSHELNLVKMKNAIQAQSIEPLDLNTAETLTQTKSGFMGPVGLDQVKFIIDQQLKGQTGLTCGANKTDYHHFGFTPERDVKNIVWGDIRNAEAGDLCARCDKGTYRAFRGIEVGQVFKLGLKYSVPMKCNFLDMDGKEKPMVMGCYGIGVTRTVAAAIEQNHDEDGIIWPTSIAPYHFHILNLDSDSLETSTVVDEIEAFLRKEGIEFLIDDRAALSPGAKFKDADLIGLPYRITVGSKGLKEGNIEIRNRKTKAVEKIPMQQLRERILELNKDLF